MLAKAIALVSTAFIDVKDKGGQPYVLHCLRVMNKIPKKEEELRCIAVMHDLIEDTEYTLSDLIGIGFSERVIKGVNLLTKKENISYDEYIKQISTSSDAIKVKLADIEDNSLITRLKGLRQKDIDRMVKYHKSWLFLNNCLITKIIE